MQNRFKKASLVAVVAIIDNILTMLYGLIYNRLIMLHYGSSITGLVSTLSQFASLFTVIEGGFSLAVVVATYKPILDNDFEELNSILYTAKKYFNKITVIYICLVMVSGVVYVYFLKTPVGFLYALLLLSLTTSTTALTIGGLTKYTVVISGYNKQYVTTVVGIICKTITWVIALVLIIQNSNIVFVYSLNVVTVILNTIALKLYENKVYPNITYKGVFDMTKIKGVKDILFQKVASTVFTSTDLILVSLGLSLSKASVYNTYNLIFSGVYLYLSAFSNAPTDSFGQLIKSGERETAVDAFLIFKKTVVILSTVLFTTAAAMIIPFLEIYTRSIKDENYIVPSLAIAFFSYYFLKINNLPYGMIINVSGEFKKQNIQTGLSAIINIVCSLVFMNYIGLNGIVLGSAVGTLIIIVANIVKARDIIAFDNVKDIVILIINYMVAISISLVSCLYMEFTFTNYLVWLLVAIMALIVIAVVVVIINYCLDRNTVKMCLRYYRNKICGIVK